MKRNYHSNLAFLDLLFNTLLCFVALFAGGERVNGLRPLGAFALYFENRARRGAAAGVEVFFCFFVPGE